MEILEVVYTLSQEREKNCKIAGLNKETRNRLKKLLHKKNF